MPIKSTKIIGVDSKGGRRSRTGSFVSMGITDREAIDCQDYFLDLADGEEPMGKVKKIELVIYYEDDMTTNLEDKIDSMSTTLDESMDLSNNSQTTLEDVIIDQDEEAEKEHLPANQVSLDIFDEDKKQEVPRVGRVYDDNGNKL